MWLGYAVAVAVAASSRCGGAATSSSPVTGSRHHDHWLQQKPAPSPSPFPETATISPDVSTPSRRILPPAHGIHKISLFRLEETLQQLPSQNSDFLPPGRRLADITPSHSFYSPLARSDGVNLHLSPGHPAMCADA